HKSPDALVSLRRVAAESKDPRVLATVMPRLVDFQDTASYPILLDAMDSPEKSVREVAYDVFLKMLLDTRIPLALEYHPEASLEDRTKVTRKLREYLTRSEPTQQKAAPKSQ